MHNTFPQPSLHPQYAAPQPHTMAPQPLPEQRFAPLPSHRTESNLSVVQKPAEAQPLQVKQLPTSTIYAEQEFRAMERQVGEQQKGMLINMRKSAPEEQEQGYFKELIKSVTEANTDVDKLSSWYENKFLPNDLVFQMREYWEKQQPEILMKNIRGDLKRELMHKTDKLHTLEGEWQDIYFRLLAKEDEIRQEEKELKDSLSQFMDLFKRAAKEQKKTK